MAMTDRELLAAVGAEFESAMGSSGGEISIERAKAWRYYHRKKLGNEVEGQSSVVTSDVSDVVDGLMPSLLRLFTTADNLITFDPQGPEDMAAAEQESDYVNYVFFKENDAFTTMYNWFFDALVQKNGIVKAFWDEQERVSQESYQGLSREELMDLAADDELEIVERSEREQETVDEETGQVIVDTVHDVVFRRITKRGCVKVDNVPPEEYRISSDANKLDPSNARMVGQERDIKRTDLIEMGFDKKTVDMLPAIGEFPETEEGIARRDKTDETRGASHDHSQDEICVREAYMKIDYDGDGRAELRQVFTAGNFVLSNEVVDRQPFHVICPQPLPHKHFGIASSEKVMDVQDVNTTLLRQTLDNLYHSNNPGHAVWEQGMGETTMDDLLTTRIGRVARFQRPVGESYQPMTVPFTAGNSFQMIEYFDKVKRDRTGISSDGEGLNPEALKNIQTTVMAQASDISRMKIEAVARIFAETGIKTMFLHIHELVLKHQDKAQIVRLRNRWVNVDPSQWRTRYDVTVNIGLGIGTREQNLLHLNAIWEKQSQIVENGGMNLMISPRNIYNTAAEIVKNANLKQPEMFFTDPGDAQAPPPSDEQMQLQQQQQKLMERQQQLDAQKQALDQQKQQIDREKAQVSNDTDRLKIMLQHRTDLAKIDVQREDSDKRLFAEMEKVRNQITELELKFGQDIPGART